MKECRFLIFVLFVGVLISCHRSEYTYYCKEMDFTFRILEKDSIDILVFDDNDSVFLPKANGQYLGLQFYIPEDSNIIYYEKSSFFFPIYRYAENKYKIQFVKSDYINEDIDKSFFNNHFWRFYGGCDQGRYTFGVWHDSLYLGSLEPLEWK